MLIFGLSLSLLIGASLGLFGSGGAIFLVPVLTTVFVFSAKTSIAMSLFLVGVTTFVGLFAARKLNNFPLISVLPFGLSSLIATFIGSKLSSQVSDKFQLLLFSSVMSLASIPIIWRWDFSKSKRAKNQTLKYSLEILVGFTVGLLTGFLGVGGGFMIVPALIVILGMKVSEAARLSLFFITVNSFVGFLSLRSVLTNDDWQFMRMILPVMIVGLFIGLYLQKKVDAEKLRFALGLMILIVGLSFGLKTLMS